MSRVTAIQGMPAFAGMTVFICQSIGTVDRRNESGDDKYDTREKASPRHPRIKSGG
jgi:hypothetical protein